MADERAIRGIQAQVQAAINRCPDGAYVTLDLTTAQKVVEYLKQLRHIERQHDPASEVHLS